MNGRLLPIPGCNEPKTVKHSIGSIWGHPADARPDVTQRGADQGEARALTLAKSDIVRYRQSIGLETTRRFSRRGVDRSRGALANCTHLRVRET
jgi:hypothetical protein